MVIVDNFPSGFNLEGTLSDDGVRDNTLSTGIPATSATDGAPTPPVGPSFQAALDNTWPRSNDPGAPKDADMVRLQDFVSESGKNLDGAIHSFRQEQLEHDTRVDSILQDIRADRLDPDSFITTQELDHRVTRVLGTMAPLPAAITAMEAKFDAIFSNFHTSFLSDFTASVMQLESAMTMRLLLPWWMPSHLITCWLRR